MYKPETIKPKPMSVDELRLSPQHYIRYGDSCWIMMTGKGPKKRPAVARNSTGADLNMPGLAEALRETLAAPRKNVKYGIMPNILAGWPEATIKEIAPGVDWWHGDLWKDLYVSQNEDCHDFFEWLKTQRVGLVGPAHLKEVKEISPAHHIEVGLDSYLERERVLYRLREISHKVDVVLLSAGLLTQILVWTLAEEVRFQMIDTGAFLDPYAGVKSRAFHREGRKIALKRRPV